MPLVRSFLTVVVAILAFAVCVDLGGIAFGGLTADAYYLPLRAVPVGDNREQIEDVLIRTHGRMLRHQRGLWLVVHGLALGSASLAYAATWRRTT